jgi:hypothetical protein
MKHVFVKSLLTYYIPEQAESPHDRISMISHKGLLAALTMLTGDENNTVRDLAQFVIAALAGKNPILFHATPHTHNKF